MIKIFAPQKSFNFLLPTFLLVTLSLFLQSCDALRGVATTKQSRFGNKGVSIKNLLDNSTVLNDHFMGFMLYDPSKKKVLHEQNAHKYFTPASNTKIFTLLTALKSLGDSLPVFQYEEKGDSLFLFPSGNPAFLHPAFQQNERVLNFLRRYKGKIYVSPTQFMENHYGAGWAWDDYTGNYAPERAALPMYGNVVSFERSTKKLIVQPPYFQALTKKNDFIQEEATRALDQNAFEWNSNKLQPNGDKVQIPFKTSAALSVQLLSDTLHREVHLLKFAKRPSFRAKILNYTPIDTVLRKMMYESDNLLAEHLLLMSAAALTDTLMVSNAIRIATKSYLLDAPDAPIWVDGSGLSRYNLFTPATVVKTLEHILQSAPQARILSLFPEGGKSGTIKSWYDGNPSYVFAKTGTLSNVHCLSGYIRTKQRGKLLIFSFMHNNFPDGSRAIKVEMQKILEFVRDNY
jgi:serine-type D-Ala-D-Ala carboxypeptidase/endopeptidase (penicillin-binding protein 4)